MPRPLLSQRAKKLLKLLLKITVSGAAIAFVVTKIDLAQTWEMIKTVDSICLVGALFIYVASQTLSSLRLNSLFARLPLPLGTRMNLRLYWLGMFYNFFLPGGIGGDGYKVYYLNRYYRVHVKDLVAVILGDRLSGMAVILCYLLIFSSFYVEQIPIPMREYLFLLIPFVLAGYYAYLYFFARQTLAAFWEVIGYSFVIQGLQMTAATFILFSLAGLDCPVQSYMFLFLVSSIASAIPITLGGIGAREMAFVIGSAYLGTDEATAVSLSVLFYAVSLVSSIPGITFVIKPKLVEGRKEHKGSHLYSDPSDPKD